MKTFAADLITTEPTVMIYQQTVEKLRTLRLEGMAQALDEQRQQTSILDLDFEERLGLLVERQCLWQENRGLALRLKSAQFKINYASLEDLDYRPSRGLKRAQIDQLRAAQWIQQHRSCIVTGPTGTGKTYLACALGVQGCRDGYPDLQSCPGEHRGSATVRIGVRPKTLHPPSGKANIFRPFIDQQVSIAGFQPIGRMDELRIAVPCHEYHHDLSAVL